MAVNESQSNRFKNGNLVRLSLRDFMTYNKVELNSGPNLNLVLGPNGTGKSALVCAIIIGLGGDPTTTGRSGHLGSYESLKTPVYSLIIVMNGCFEDKFGCDSALVEIELYNETPNAKNFLIQRLISAKRNNSGKVEYNSSFKLNGSESNRTHVREFIRTLNINVDNLCQFLPQERVIEFVKMDRKTLLECTEKAAGNEDMFESHQQIVSLTKSIKKINEMNTDLNQQISTETELQQRAEEELKRIEERDRFKEEINWLKKKKPWIEYEDKRLEYTSAKDDLIKKKEELQRVSKSLDPLKSAVNDSRKSLVKLEAIKAKTVEDLKRSTKTLEPIVAKIEDKIDKIRETKTYFYEQMDNENKRKDKLKQLESDLSSLKEQFDNINEDLNVEQQIEETVKHLNAVNANISKLKQNNMKFKEENENLVIERNRLDSRRKALEDVFRRRLEKLRELDMNAAKAYEWLQKNQNIFKERIHPPIMTQINIKQIEWSKYVESAIARNDLISFVCENSDDLKLFTQSVKNDLNIRVNVVMAPNENADQFEPNFNIRDYSQFGVFSVVKDMFTAPNKVMAYLCKTLRLHCIPVGDNTMETKITHLINSSQFKRIYSNKNMYNITVSRYDNEKVIRSDSIPEAKYLNLTIDENQLTELKRKIVAIDEQISVVKTKTLENDNKLAEMVFKSNDLREKKKLLDNQKNEKRILITKINEKKEHIIRTQKSAVNLNEVKQKSDQKLKELFDIKMKLLDEMNSITSECVQKNEQKLRSILSEALVRKKLQIAERKLSNASIQFQELKNELRRLELSLNDLKKEAKDLRNAAKELSGFDVNENLSQDIRTKFDAMPNSLDEINNKIGTLRLRMESILDADESVRDTYNKRRRDIEKRKKDLELRQIDLRDKLSKLEQLKSRWLPDLEELIAKINTSFGNFMARLNCAGDVSLYKANDSDCFDEYGISIKVKFRQTEQLKELTSFHQSGGERSVSTMIYMIALQELTHVPFRCVDEINQGMDENNERSVFDLISETSSRNSSQYFLFSPKLLTDLTYTNKMKIHIICNGPYNEFDWSRICYESDDE